MFGKKNIYDGTDRVRGKGEMRGREGVGEGRLEGEEGVGGGRGEKNGVKVRWREISPPPLPLIYQVEHKNCS